MEAEKINVNGLNIKTPPTMIDYINELHRDLKTSLKYWFWYLDECNDYDNPEFNTILKKYNLTLDDIL